jgi:hypothetical protein
LLKLLINKKINKVLVVTLVAIYVS